MEYGKAIYVATIDNSNSKDGIVIYNEPIKFILKPHYLSIQPASGYYSIQVYGKDITKVWHGMAIASRFESVFHEGDLLYLDGVKPCGESEYGEKANAYIDNVNYQNKFIYLTIKKRVCNE